jgi:VanZ family protein
MDPQRESLARSDDGTLAAMFRAFRIALPVYWLLLATATHYPQVQIPGEVPHSDKLLHFAAFGALAFLFSQVVRARVRTSGAILIAYAALDEWSQQFVGRSTELMDFIANVAGVVAVLAAVEVYRRWRARRQRDQEIA